MPCCKHKVLTTFYRKGTYHNTAAKLQALSDNQSEEFKAFINVLYDKLQNSFSLLSHMTSCYVEPIYRDYHETACHKIVSTYIHTHTHTKRKETACHNVPSF